MMKLKDIQELIGILKNIFGKITYKFPLSSEGRMHSTVRRSARAFTPWRVLSCLSPLPINLVTLGVGCNIFATAWQFHFPQKLPQRACPELAGGLRDACSLPCSCGPCTPLQRVPGGYTEHPRAQTAPTPGSQQLTRMRTNPGWVPSKENRPPTTFLPVPH